MGTQADPALPLSYPQVFRQRLEQEHGASVLITPPTVPVRVSTDRGGEEVTIDSPAQFPSGVRVTSGAGGAEARVVVRGVVVWVVVVGKAGAVGARGRAVGIGAGEARVPSSAQPGQGGALQPRSL